MSSNELQHRSGMQDANMYKPTRYPPYDTHAQAFGFDMGSVLTPHSIDITCLGSHPTHPNSTLDLCLRCRTQHCGPPYCAMQTGSCGRRLHMEQDAATERRRRAECHPTSAMPSSVHVQGTAGAGRGVSKTFGPQAAHHQRSASAKRGALKPRLSLHVIRSEVPSTDHERSDQLTGAAYCMEASAM